MNRFEILRDLLAQSRFFKLVCGAGNENVLEVRRLALTYTLAGATGFDVSATPEVVTACVQGIARAIEIAPQLRCNVQIRPFITVSVGMPGDHHVRKAYIVEDCVQCGKCIYVCPTNAISDQHVISRERCIGCGNCEAICPPKIAAIRYEHNPKLLDELLPKCIAAGAENIELHAAVPGDEKIREEWQTVSSAQPENFVSMCLDRFHLSNMHLIDRVKMARAIAGGRTMIQADGVPMSGGADDFNTTLQAVAIADVINKNLKEKDSAFRDMPILLSGGTNGKTAEMARLCNVSFQGVSIGTHARKIVKKWIAQENFEQDENALREAVAVAEDLVLRSIAK